MDKSYWSSDLPHPLAPNDYDVIVYQNYMIGGSTLLLGCTKKLIPLTNRQLDIDPWYDADTVIQGDWIKNKHFYSNILIDGGLCFTKELCDGIVQMASKNCNRLITRSFDRKLDIMKVAAYFPHENDFLIKPKFVWHSGNDYSFYVWDF